jgi:large subunit ribosomal protein L49
MLDSAWKSLEERIDTSAESSPAQIEEIINPSAESSPSPSEIEETDTSAEASPSPSQTDRPTLPYHVSRTHTNNLPVYTDIKSGGTRLETRIQKVHGNSHALLKDVSNALSLADVKAYVKLPGGHVIFAGRHKERIVDFLLKRGF